MIGFTSSAPGSFALTAILTTWLCAPVAHGADDGRPAVVELYTSEGCSSCPPAEQMLGVLRRNPDVLAVAFHVDYWDSPGWRDPFALRAASQRQRELARRASSPIVATPQFFIDGRPVVAGANGPAILNELKKPRIVMRVIARVEGLNLIVDLPEQPGRDGYDVYAVGFVDQAITHVQGGENAGRTLTEYNVVRSIRRLGAARGPAHRWGVPVESFPKDANRALIFLQQLAGGAIVGATLVNLR